MAVLTFKCPNCGGELVFDPANQNYRCPYCGSEFTQQELDALTPAQTQERPDETQEGAGFGEAEDVSAQETQADSAQSTQATPGAGGEAMVYQCPSCGAEIVTDSTTAATFCYYCHNPVVLEGRLSGDMMPDSVIPFRIDRKEAEKRFREFVSSKKFVPKAFWNDSQIEKLSGVYYPFWRYNCESAGRMDAKATKLRVYRTANEEITETNVYRIKRSGNLELSDMTRDALKKSDRNLVDNVQPFNLAEAQPFKMGYLSGFFAEKRDIPCEEYQDEMNAEAKSYTERSLRETISGYTGVDVLSFDSQIRKGDWDYVLLPVWVLTYQSGGKNYYFAMNGQNGKAVGVLPVDTGKLTMISAIAGVVVAALIALGGFLL